MAVLFLENINTDTGLITQLNNDQDDRIPGNNILSSDINSLYTDPQISGLNINPEKKNSVQKQKIFPD
jgi:hypothetical protein